MPNSMNERELFEALRQQETLRKIRHVTGTLLGHPCWWLCQRIGKNPKFARRAVEHSFALWSDARVKHGHDAGVLLGQLRRWSSHRGPFRFESRSLGACYGVPLRYQDKLIGHLALTGLRKPLNEAALRTLLEFLNVLLDRVAKTEELTRLSATIRPRAVALSTVHTVHRIINSTLNLDELVSRLAHLTAQVLRVHRCAIYLIDEASKKKGRPALRCKAKVGYPPASAREQWIPWGQKLEGRVAKQADIQLRKKVLCIPLIDEDVIGVVTVAGKKDKKDFNHFDLEILTTLAEEAVIAIKNAQLYEEQRRVTLGTIQSLALVLGSRGKKSSLLSPEAFARLATRTGQEMKLSEEEVQALHYAALLKDTTRIGIPEEILRKPSKLTGEELLSLKKHTIAGAKIVENFESLKTVAPIILYSREKYDGSGYPEGLKGEKIPVGARILAVISAYEAIVVGRPYRDQSSSADAVKELQKNSGTQFDPLVVQAFVGVVKKEGPRRRPAHGPGA